MGNRVDSLEQASLRSHAEITAMAGDVRELRDSVVEFKAKFKALAAVASVAGASGAGLAVAIAKLFGG